MSTIDLTPENSLLLISKTIQDTKQKFRENGTILIFWGSMISLVTLSQFILIQMGMANRTGFPSLLYPLVGIPFTFFYTRKKYNKDNVPKTIIGNIIVTMAWHLSGNLLILGFFFSSKLGDFLTPIMLLLIAIFAILVGKSIKFKPILIGGIILNLMAFAAFYISWQYHPLLMLTGSVIALLVPGIILNNENRKEHV